MATLRVFGLKTGNVQRIKGPKRSATFESPPQLPQGSEKFLCSLIERHCIDSSTMSGLFSSLWSILTSYRPNAARDRQYAPSLCHPSTSTCSMINTWIRAQPLRFGAFEATYYPVGYGIRRPRNDEEAQRWVSYSFIELLSCDRNSTSTWRNDDSIN